MPPDKTRRLATASSRFAGPQWLPRPGLRPGPGAPANASAIDIHSAPTALERARQVAGDLAEEHTGLPAADLRFESIAPVSASARALWSRTAAFVCGQLIGSRVTEISAITAEQMTRLAAAALLETFPNTTMTPAYIPGPGHVPPAAVRRAAAFIEAHAEQPVTATEIAAVAGATVRDIARRWGWANPATFATAYRKHYGVSPGHTLRT